MPLEVTSYEEPLPLEVELEPELESVGAKEDRSDRHGRSCSVRVTFWGTRGSIATPGPDTVRYGGNTSCVSIRTDDGTLIVIDCGTGARTLGRHLLAESGGEPVDGHIFVSHTHWDHIQGFPFFQPLFQPGSTWHVYGPAGFGRCRGLLPPHPRVPTYR